ncbi:MAG: cell division protein ZapA [Methylococcales bacterium]
MSEDTLSTNLQIMGKDFRISCTEDEKDLLMSSARHLDKKMREIRDTGRVIGLERIAVMAALNITHEYMQLRDENDYLSTGLNQRIKTLQAKLDEQMQWEDAG